MASQLLAPHAPRQNFQLCVMPNPNANCAEQAAPSKLRKLRKLLKLHRANCTEETAPIKQIIDFLRICETHFFEFSLSDN